jgi:hypothetical protein
MTAAVAAEPADRVPLIADVVSRIGPEAKIGVTLPAK